MILGALATSLMTCTRGSFAISCSLGVRNVLFCTFGSLEPVSGYCLFSTTGTSTILSVNHHSFWAVSFSLLAPASRLWFPPLGQGIEHVALPLLSARFELVGTWRLRCTATGISMNLSLCCTCETSTVFEHHPHLPLHVHALSTNCNLMNLLGFCGRHGHLEPASATPLAHRSSCPCAASPASRCVWQTV